MNTKIRCISNSFTPQNFDAGFKTWMEGIEAKTDKERLLQYGSNFEVLGSPQVAVMGNGNIAVVVFYSITQTGDKFNF